MTLRISTLVIAAMVLGGAAVAMGQAPSDLPAPSLEVAPARGGVRLPMLYPPAMKGQPYSLLETTTTVKTLGDGTKITCVSTDRRLRDAEGRTRDDHSQMKDGKMELQWVDFTDPVSLTKTLLFAQSHTGQLTHFAEPAERVKPTPEQATQRAERLKRLAAERAAREPAESAPSEQARNEHWENLGSQNVGGIYADGLRMTTITPAGKEGNDREIRMVRELWTSPDLKISVGSTTDDPRVGTTTMVVTELERSNPDPANFQIPQEYKVHEANASLMPTR